ncbi:MAG: T9SS type A sorting domain-containing protein [Flavobacteriales bacterium]|nr:T9SS type A sorting domain-containing protein [Flavobacteriales bacterium]
MKKNKSMKKNYLSYWSKCIRNWSLVIGLAIFATEFSFGQDDDGDGVTNAQEVIDGTDPDNPCNRLSASITGSVSPDTTGNGIVDACDPIPIPCEIFFYQVIDGQFYRYNSGSGVYEAIGSASFSYNAMGYHELDGLFYAMASESGTDFFGDPIVEHDIIAIDGLGNKYFLFSPTGINTNQNYNTGFVSGNFIYVVGQYFQRPVFKIDLATGVGIANGLGFDAADGAIISDVMYGMAGNKLCAIDLTYPFDVTFKTTTYCSVAGSPSGSPSGNFGAAFVADTDQLFVSSNAGGLYRVFNYLSASPCLVQGAQTVQTTNNDGASCPSAYAPFLPIELLAFDTGCEENKVRLNWTTVTELDNDYFTIERSRDAINFESIASIAGKGSTTTMSHYIWIDESPLSGTAYYRLSQTDFDGTKETFKTRSVNCSVAQNVSLYPNPIENVFLLNSKYGGSISLFDQAGRLVLEQRIIAGMNTIQSDQIASGSYIAVVTLENGTLEVIKVIKF